MRSPAGCCRPGIRTLPASSSKRPRPPPMALRREIWNPGCQNHSRRCSSPRIPASPALLIQSRIKYVNCLEMCSLLPHLCHLDKRSLLFYNDCGGILLHIYGFFMFLPVIVLVPQKFAISFTIGSIFIVGSFFALKGPKAQFYHMISKERWPFTAGFIGSMAATIYVSVVLHSYILSVVFAVIQVLALLYYLMSYFPGGTAGMQFLTSMIMSSFTKCFGRLTSS